MIQGSPCVLYYCLGGSEPAQMIFNDTAASLIMNALQVERYGKKQRL
jgi:hypothetical protein